MYTKGPSYLVHCTYKLLCNPINDMHFAVAECKTDFRHEQNA